MIDLQEKRRLCQQCPHRKHFLCRKHGDDYRRLCKTRISCEGWGNAVPQPVVSPVKPDLPSGQIRCDVAIPYCRQNLRWLKASVDSVLNQVGAECIVHLIADGFNDPQDPALDYLNHPRVRLYRNSESIGPYRSTNRIVDRLETDYLAIQDSDDIAEPHRIAHSINAMRSQGGEMYGGAMRQFTSWETVDGSAEQKVKNVPVHKSGWHSWSVSPEGVVINGTRVVTVDAFRRLGGFAPFMMSADCEFTTRSIRAGIKVVIDQEIVALRRVHSESLSHGGRFRIGSSERDEVHAQYARNYQLMVPGFDPQQFGGLAEDLQQANQTERLKAPDRLEIPNLEIHVTHACNLSCKSCSHFSDMKVGGNLKRADLAAQMAPWSRRLKPRLFSILGGEPALNRDLVGIVRDCRELWPDSQLQLISNGFYLHRHPDLPKALEETGCNLEISIHHQGPEYTAKLEPVKALLAEWQERHSFKLNYRESVPRWRTTFEGYGSEMVPFDDGDPESSYQVCNAKHCPQIHEGKIWKCPQLAYLQLVDQKHGLGDVWDKYLSYRPLYPGCSDAELQQFFATKAEPACGMCPAHHRLFEIPNPLIQVK